MKQRQSSLHAARRRHVRSLSATALACLLTACGGGGGGGGAGPDPVVPLDVAQLSRTLLENDAGGVQAVSSDIDDQGRLVVVFNQSNGTRAELKATLGLPGALGVAPTFSTPVVIDAMAPNNGAGDFRVAVSAAGNAVAVWTVTGDCASDTYSTSGLCNYTVAARRIAGSDWEPPMLVGDSPVAASGAAINDSGDVLVGLPGWSRDAAGTLTPLTAIAWRPRASGRFTRQALPEITQAPNTLAHFGLDRLGEFTVAVNDVSSGRNSIVVARGSVLTGFRSLENLDNGAGNVALEGMWVGVNGPVMVLWQQADSGRVKRWAAAASSSGAAMVVTEQGLAPSGVSRGRFKAAVSDGGDFVAYDLDNCQFMRFAIGNWQVNQPLPGDLCSGPSNRVAAITRNGNLVTALADATSTTGNTGQWTSWNLAKGSLVQDLTSANSGSGYLFGVRSTAGGQMLLSESGLAAFISGNSFDSLPSVTNTNGTTGTSTNLWAVLLKPI